MIRTELSSVYEEVMWLAQRPNTTPSAARAWYTHIASERLKKHVRRFTGQVSRKAIDEHETLCLEHFKRMQAELTRLVTRHLHAGIHDADEFARLVVKCEQVHIVTRDENYAVMRAKGDYNQARIRLVKWSTIRLDMQRFLWHKMLRGKVANADDFAPNPR